MRNNCEGAECSDNGGISVTIGSRGGVVCQTNREEPSADVVTLTHFYVSIPSTKPNDLNINTQ